MSVKILIDMNLSPLWVEVFSRHGWSARHWSDTGDPSATDQIIMSWAREHNYAVFTHDLDFGAILAVTQAGNPSVIQVRAQDVLPLHLEDLVVQSMRQYEDILEEGALIVVDESSARARILPLS